MSFYSYIFKPSDFIKGYCFNISWMDECTHWWNTGKNEAHTAWNDHSQSACHFQTCSQILCFICNRKQLGDSEAFGTMFSIHLWVKRQRACLPAFQWQENGCWDFQLGGKNEMLQSVEARSRESWRRDKNVSIHANWCPDPPPGCHCLLSGERIKGPFTRHGDFHFFPTSTLFHLTLLFLLLGQLWYLIGAERGNFHWGSVKKKSSFCLFKVNMEMPECTQPTSLRRGEGHIEFSVKAMTDGCRGTLVSAGAPRSPGFTGCEQATLIWDGSEDSQGRTEVPLHSVNWKFILCSDINLKIF